MTEQPPADAHSDGDTNNSFGAGIAGSASSSNTPSSGTETDKPRASKGRSRSRRKATPKADRPETGDRESPGAETALAERPDERSSENSERPHGGDAGSEEAGGKAKVTRRRRGSRGGRRRKRHEDDEGAAQVDSIPGEDDDLVPESHDEEGGARKKKSDKRSSQRSSSRKSSTDSASPNDDDGQREGESLRDQDDGDDASERGGKKKRRRRRSRRKSSDSNGREDSSEEARSGSGGDSDDDDRDRDDADQDDRDAGDRKRSRKKSKKSEGKKSGGRKAVAKKSEEELEREAEAYRTQTIAVNAVEPEERRVAVFEGDRIHDLLMNAESQKTLVNDIYRGRVVNLEPAIGAAFIDFGQGKNGFLHTSDVMPIYGEDGFKLVDLLTAGVHHVAGDHDADWSEEADALDDDVADEIADIDDLEDDDLEDGDLEDGDLDSSDDLDEPNEEASDDDTGDSEEDGDDVAGSSFGAELEGSDDSDDSEDSDDAPETDTSARPSGRRTIRARTRKPSSSHMAVMPSDGDSFYADGDGSGAGSASGSSSDEGRPVRKSITRKRRPSRTAAAKSGSDEDSPKASGARSGRTSTSASVDDPKPKRKRSRKSAASDTDGADREGSDGGDGAAESAKPAKRKPRTRKAASSRAAKASGGDSEGASRESADGDEPSEGGGRRPSRSKKTRKKKADGRKVEAKKKPARKKSSKKAPRTRKQPAGKGRVQRGRTERRPQRERRPIDQLLKVGDPVVVQVTKDAIGDKGPTLTTYVSMPGRYLVLMPSMARTGVSRKIPDDKERKRLKRILASMNTPPDMGVIVRTAGIGRTKTDLQRDLDYLLGLWESFGKKLKSSRGPAPLYLESDVATRTLRDLFNRRTKEVIVDDVAVHEQLVSFATALMPEHIDRIKLHEGDRPLFQDCGIEQDFERIFARRVDLPSGGSIVFDQAEALVAIDVNSGRTRTDSYDFEEIALKTNLEAVPEIARQIRLRDLGGIIVCDFIDMVRSSSNRKVENLLRDELAPDRARSKLSRISQFGLLELTRQRLGPGTHKKVFQACPRCRGTGRVRTVESRAQAILRRLGGAVVQKGFSQVEVRAHPEVVAYLKEDLWDWVRAMEHRSEKAISLISVSDQTEDSVLRYLRADGREVRPGGRRKR